jgi:hypothetical protein
MDLKFSYFFKNKTGKTRYEMFWAVENILGLVYTAKGNPVFNPYTGKVDTVNTTSPDMPVPIPSFGFKISF